MKKIRKYVAVILAVMMLLSVTACSSPSDFYHEVILGETKGEKKDSKKEDKKDSKEDKDKDDKDDKEDTIEYEDIEYADTENQEFEDFTYKKFVEGVTADTQTYNQMIKDKSKYPDITMDEATLGDARMDAEAVAESKKKDEEFYDELIAFEDAELTEEERFTYECLKRDTEIDMHIYDNIYFQDVFTPMKGVQENLTSNFTDYRFDDKDDIEDYITQLNQVRDYFGDLIEFEYEKSEAGYFMSEPNAESVIEQCEEFLSKKDDHALIEAFDEHIDELDFISEEEKADFKERNKKAVMEVVMPAYEDLIAAFEELKGTGKNDGGICNYEGGKDYYANYIFPKYSGSAKTPEEEIEIMDQRWDDLVTQMSVLYYSNPEGYEWFIENSSEAFKKYDEMDAEELVKLLQENYMDDYPLDATIPFSVKYMSESVEKISENTLAYYQINPIDDPNFNLICVNGSHSDGMFNTLAHEGNPGHMFQFWYFRNTDHNPIRDLSFNLGYIEGWAVYSSYDTEKKCDLEGESDYGTLPGELSQINTDLSYLMIGRTDLGVNYEGWDKDDLVAYLTGKVNEGEEETVAEDLYNMVCADPGVYLSYTTGFYEMEELRKYAEDELGSKFDAKEYHKAILDAGSCQFELLRKKVDKYIEENR